MTDDHSTTEYAAVADSRRRHVCEYLSSNDDVVVTLEEVTQAVADAERIETGATVAGTDDHRIATSLHHVHLPALEEAGVLEYDWDRRLLAVGSGLSEALELLESLDDSSSEDLYA